jgi:RimJ/RimL family protein N-acetyltransferase
MSASAEDILQARLNLILAGTDTIELPLYEERGATIGVMRPLTAHHLDQMSVIKNLTDWRNANMANFLTHFEATTARTQAWVENIVLKNRGQMLWLVFNDNDDLIGHFGFKNLTYQSVLLDNAMRGKRQGHPKLFVVAGKTMVQWLWKTTPVQRIDAYVMADNVPSIMMNRQIGFRGWKRHPLIKRIVDGNIQWYMGEEGQNSPDGRYCFNLFIERDADALAPT